MDHSTEPTPDSLWEAISGRLKEVLSETTYDTWLAHAEPCSLGDGRLVVAVPNEFTRDWIESHFRGFVSAAARESSGRITSGSRSSSKTALRHRPSRPPAIAEAGPRAAEFQPGDSWDLGLNQKYTFDTFIIGSSNRFAHAAALAVAEAPAQAYNPLFIYGSTGLGKTHLLQAIGHYVSRHSRRLTPALRHQ